MYVYRFEPKQDITVYELAVILSVVLRAQDRMFNEPVINVTDEQTCRTVDDWLWKAKRHFVVDKE